eukprot:s4662_g2.t1
MLMKWRWVKDLQKPNHQISLGGINVSDEAGWILQVIQEPAREGRHFIDILEPVLGNIIRAAIPGAPKRQKVAFAMEKAAVMDLPQAHSIGKVYAGLGWDASAVMDIDLDVSAVVMTKDCQVLGAVFFGQLEGWALKHSGDNLTGEGEGDDEVIELDLPAIPAEVSQIFFVVNIYTRGVTFENVESAYCRIFDSTGEEMARYALRDGRGEKGLVMGRFFLEFSGDAARWSFQALGSFCQGQTWKDSVPAIVSLARKSAKQLQMRSGTISMLGGQPAGGGHAPVAAMPPIQEPPRSTACAVL